MKKFIENYNDQEREALVLEMVSRVFKGKITIKFIERKDYDHEGEPYIYWIYGISRPGLNPLLQESATLGNDGFLEIRVHPVPVQRIERGICPNCGGRDTMDLQAFRRRRGYICRSCNFAYNSAQLSKFWGKRINNPLTVLES